MKINFKYFKEISIDGNNGFYFINRQGVIFSKKTNKIIKGMSNGRYIQAKLNGKFHILHRLVMITFEPIENYHLFVVNHKDKNTCNNSVSNLEWNTQKQNIAWNKINSSLSIHNYKRDFSKINVLKGEVWENITITNNEYSCSNLGRIKSNERYIKGVRYGEKLLLAKSCRKDGYVRIIIYTAKLRKKHFYAHRLIATTFLNNPLNLPQVNHIDGNKSNNSIVNLEWISRKGNAQHARDVLNVQPMGSKHYLTKFTEQDVLNIHEMKKRGIKLKDIGEIFKVHYTTISKIVTGVNWKQVKAS